MAELEKVIKGLEICIRVQDNEKCPDECPYRKDICYGTVGLMADALSLLKAQELPDVKPEKLEEKTAKWLDQMTAEERLEEIAAILDDWDGYRTAKGLGGLINEVWAYTLYPVKAQEARVMTLEEVEDALDTVVWVDRPLLDNLSDEYALIDAYSRKTQIVELRYPFCDKDYRERADYATYGKTWRCWTARPTDEQREATPWAEPPKEG